MIMKFRAPKTKHEQVAKYLRRCIC